MRARNLTLYLTFFLTKKYTHNRLAQIFDVPLCEWVLRTKAKGTRMARITRKTKSKTAEDNQGKLDLSDIGSDITDPVDDSEAVTLEGGITTYPTNQASSVHNLDGNYDLAPLKNGVMLMHLPFFPTKSYVKPRYHTFDFPQETVTLELDPNPKYGGPSITDADIIKFFISALKSDVANDRLSISEEEGSTIHCLRFSAQGFFKFTKRDSNGGSQLTALRNSLNRLKSINVNFYRKPKDPKSKIVRVSNHSSFILDWSEVTKDGSTRDETDVTKDVWFFVRFATWMTPFFFRNEAILTLNRVGYFYLDPAEKKWYEYLHSALGRQIYFKTRLKLIIRRLDYEPDKDGEYRGRNLHYIRDELYQMIASDDLLGISLAIEPKKPCAEEMVYFFRSNWKHCKSKVPDPVKPKEFLTKLEAAIFKKEGLIGLQNFRGLTIGTHKGLLKTEDVRELYKKKDYRKWLDKFEKDQAIIERGDAISKGLSGYRALNGKEQKRYDRLKHCQDLASPHPTTKADTASEKDSDIIDVVQD